MNSNILFVPSRNEFIGIYSEINLFRINASAYTHTYLPLSVDYSKLYSEIITN